MKKRFMSECVVKKTVAGNYISCIERIAFAYRWLVFAGISSINYFLYLQASNAMIAQRQFYLSGDDIIIHMPQGFSMDELTVEVIL